MIKQLLSNRNKNKRVIARMHDISIVELLDRVDASEIAFFKYAIVQGENGILLSLGDLMALPDLINSAAIRESAAFAEYSAEHAEEAKSKTYLW